MANRLDREIVVRAALGLLNEVGLDGLTLRRIAENLAVQAPALYWHFKNKQALLDEMGTSMFKDLLAEGASLPADLPWAEWMAVSMRTLRGMLLRYRDGAKVFSGTYLTDDAVLESMEAPLQRLTDAGFSLSRAVRAWSTLYMYTIGYVIEEQAAHASPGQRDPRYLPAVRARRIDVEKFPLTSAAGKESFANFDQGFDQGLELIIAGIERSLDKT